MCDTAHEAMTNLFMVMQIQLLRNREQFSWDEAEDDSAGQILVWFVTLQHAVSNDFSERVRQAMLGLPIAEGHAAMHRLMEEIKQ